MNHLLSLLYCSRCGKNYIKNGESFECSGCNKTLFLREDVLVDSLVSKEKDKEFYDAIYSNELGEKWFQGLNRNNFVKKIFEKISLSYRRERFFKKNFKGKENVILDIACGAGRDYFKKYGTVIGVDLSYEALTIAKKDYDLVVQSGVECLPFPDNTFDYVVSSDFFGHVRNEDKDSVIQEIYRVLKPGGKTMHIIENDSTNVWFRIAHSKPELFKKYFVDEIGGHIGLELPSVCVERWEKNNFNPVVVKKIWGLIWPIQAYVGLFDNEYKESSFLVRMVVRIAKILSKVKIVRLGVDVILNPINSLIESITSINKGQGIMIVCEKKKF